MNVTKKLLTPRLQDSSAELTTSAPSSGSLCLDMTRKSSSVIALEPYTPARSEGKFTRNLCGIFETLSYDNYLTFNLGGPHCAIFNVHRNNVKHCGQEPKISQGRGKVKTESASPKESEKLKGLLHLGGVKVACSIHTFWNHSKGMIFALKLKMYSEEKPREEFKDKSVIRVERMSINCALALLPN